MTKNLFITGASKGLGYAIVNEFQNKGWQVYCVVRNKTHASMIKNINPKKIIPIIGDVTSPEIFSEIRKNISQTHKIDLLINNAGISQVSKNFLETDINEIRYNLEVHCIGSIRTTQAVFPFLNNNASIINISSRFGSIKKISKGELDHIPCSYSYKIAKGAQNMFTQCLSREIKDTNIKICSLHPGQLKTKMAAPDADHTPEEAAQKIFELKDNIKNGKFYSLFEKEFEI